MQRPFSKGKKQRGKERSKIKKRTRKMVALKTKSTMETNKKMNKKRDEKGREKEDMISNQITILNMKMMIKPHKRERKCVSTKIMSRIK